MKKFENLGRRLSKEEQKKIMGGNPTPGTCKAKATNCNKSCSCDTEGTNTCTSYANSVYCNCDGIEVELHCTGE